MRRGCGLNLNLLLLLLLLLFYNPNTLEATATATPFSQMLALVQQEPVVLKYHKGPLLKGNLTLNLLWYGNFTLTQRSIILNFIQSLTNSSTHRRRTQSPSAASWWQTTATYTGRPCTLTVGNQILDHTYSLGKSLKASQLIALTSTKTEITAYGYNRIHVVLTAADVAVEDFCMNQCGTHGSLRAGKKRVVYAWVGNPESQCPGECAWPFHQPLYGPQAPPLVPPNGDVGMDGMVISLATVLAGAVTNPFGNGYYQGTAMAPLEAVSACTGMFGKGAYPGYAGEVPVDKRTGASYNAVGMRGRRFLLPAMWDPLTSSCKTLV
ncbi:hypothetical protein HN51_052771 [Arachis hypogaea]|uniref:Protein EXORDIUM-like 2 n=1 Tax=Arachis hypogaea TaxID=3818 RepID=A0A445C9E3_ARAHY|nr:protein EXORDIUM-like 2 [Arachis ipaensis]XP_025668951.1 protein EXORDIUM-like 2 [Arachis hypogaea]QHN94193.1 Protein EXORDIUM-like [Arachis hypogaea]RYR47558.1 hypothetical protein Ahy_A07g033494 [Arachis hypogaea]